MKIVGFALILIGFFMLQPVSAEELFDVDLSDRYFNDGLNYYFSQEYPAAVLEFEESIRINPDNAKAYYFIGYAYYRDGEYKKASEAFETAYELNREYSPIPQEGGAYPEPE